EKQRSAERERDRECIVNEQHRKQEYQRSGEPDDDGVAPRPIDVAGPFENRIRQYAARGISDHAGEKHARGEQRRSLEREMIAFGKKGRQPGQEQPQRPGAAKKHQRDRQNANKQSSERDLSYLALGRMEGGKIREFGWRNALVIARVVAKVSDPDDDP